jgi:formate dehydrogenase subunit beta
MINKVKAWLEDGTIDIFLGYKETDHHPLPHCFTKERIEEVEDLVLSPVRYSLEKIATHMAAVEPDIKIGCWPVTATTGHLIFYISGTS